MQRKLTGIYRTEEEEIKEAGFVLDFDEIARKGDMSKEEKLIAKWYGVYTSRQPGNFMARVVIPGGIMTAQQARCFASTSYKYGQGIMNITTRQAIQFHWLKMGHLADMMRELNTAHLTTFHGCGDVTRIVAACPLAESCEYARFDVRKYAVATQKYLGSFRDLDNLPRKFKITYSGCDTGCGQPFINCVGIVAQQVQINGTTEFGFKVIIGGGLGWKQFIGQQLFSFVPQNQILEVTRAIALLYRDYGDRTNRIKSRLKFVVHRQGIEFCREIVLANLKAEGKQIDNILHIPIRETGGDVPYRIQESMYAAADGTTTVGIRVPKGELTYSQMNSIAELSEEFGNQHVYTTNRQNLELKGVKPASVPALKQRIRDIGLHADGLYGIQDIVPCVGTTYCPKAVSETRALHDNLHPVLQLKKYEIIRNSVLINISGCPNSCSQYSIFDIGFRGMRIREEQGSVEGYEMRIGGSHVSFGKILGEFKTTDIPEVTETALDTFIKLRNDSETLAQTVQRIGVEPFKEAVLYAI